MYLEHSETCPNRIYRQFVEMESGELKFSENLFRLAVCMVLADRNKKVLITRRHIQMKIFPHAWVLPGGHVEHGESLEDAVIRELGEETGVKIESQHPKNGASIYYYKGKQCHL